MSECPRCGVQLKTITMYGSKYHVHDHEAWVRCALSRSTIFASQFMLVMDEPGQQQAPGTKMPPPVDAPTPPEQIVQSKRFIEELVSVQRERRILKTLRAERDRLIALADVADDHSHVGSVRADELQDRADGIEFAIRVIEELNPSEDEQ